MNSIRLKLMMLLVCISVASFAQTQTKPETTTQTIPDQKPAKTDVPVSSPTPAPSAPSVSSRSLAGQFNEIKDKSNTYADYKVVKINALNAFWKNVSDSINAIRKEIPAALQKIESQKKELDILKKEVAVRDQGLRKGEYDKANLTVFGMDMPKENYVYLSWAVVGILVLALVIAFFKYNTSKRIATEKRREYDAISNELNDFKQKAREKELKIGRELQTERNKIEELNQKIASLKKQVHL